MGKRGPLWGALASLSFIRDRFFVDASCSTLLVLRAFDLLDYQGGKKLLYSRKNCRKLCVLNQGPPPPFSGSPVFPSLPTKSGSEGPGSPPPVDENNQLKLIIEKTVSLT